MKTRRFKNIDYGFRPDSYGNAADPLAAALLNVKGTNRRKMIIDYWNAGKFEKLEDELKRANLSAEKIHMFGRFHPSFMGGEYLPDYRARETEIARIELRSVTADVISIRARPVGNRIRYSVSDEYETEFELARQTSLKPLTLEQLVQFIDESRYPEGPGLALGNNEGNVGDLLSRKDLRHFTSVTSEIYSQLFEHYEQVFDEWVNEPQEEQ